MNRRRLIELAVIGIVVFFIGYQFFTSYFSAITTESAIYFEHSKGVELDGIIIKNELIVTSKEQGTLHYVISDGESVAKGGTIAQVYNSDKASAAATRIDEINRQLKNIEDIEGYNDKNAVNMSAINAKIISKLNDFLYKVSDNRFDGIDEARDELIAAMTRKQVAMGEQTDFTAIKNQLNMEKNALKSVVGSPKAVCTVEKAGYFVFGVDGYENSLSPNDLSIYTPEYLEELAVSETGKDVIGKIIYDYEWHIAVKMSIEESMFYKNGDSVKLKINSIGQTVNTKVNRINISKESSTATVILTCSEMSSELSHIRTGRVTIIKDEYSGLRINPKAIRIVDGVTGVYVVSGLEVKFVKANVIFSNEEYAICELNTTDDEQLRLYDEFVVKGRGLYDGKIIY